MNIEFVIARYKENIDWLLPYLDCDIKITIYNKNDDIHDSYIKNIDKRFNIIDLPNIGNEAHTYLYHIVNNYNNLADINFFLQGKISDHLPCITWNYNHECPYKTLNEMFEDCAKYESSNNYTVINEFCNKQSLYTWREKNYKNEELNNYICCFGDFFTTHIKNIFPDKLICYKFGLFCVSNNKIRKKSLYYYQHLLNLPFKKNDELSHFFEHCWFYIFNN